MKWCEVKIQINSSASEAAAEILRKKGAEGVILDQENSRTELKAYYPDGFSPAVMEERIRGLVNFGLEPGKIEFAIKSVRDEEWKSSWKEFVEPVKAGNNFVICPEGKECSDSERIKIRIIPGMAFGLGGHESTQLALSMLETFVTSSRQNMLDAGCGTGILALAAARLGQRQITAVDVADNAVRACRRNIKLNRINEDIIKVYRRDIAEVEGDFSLITANLLSRYLCPLLSHLSGILSPEGLIILSGLLIDEEEEIIFRLNDLGLNIIERKRIGDWAAVVAGGV
ncbi:MAG: 50S ribosomal protein L11 methyltransferase [Halanaerobiales bacterium]